MKNNWLDKYNNGGPLPSNYNDAQASYPPAFVGEGTFNGPMFNNGAVNGQFQKGGYVPPTMPDLRHPGGSDIQGMKKQSLVDMTPSKEWLRSPVDYKSDLKQIKQNPNAKLYNDDELRAFSKIPFEKLPKTLQEGYYENERIKAHPDYNPNNTLESQRTLNDDNSLRTKVLRGKNTLQKNIEKNLDPVSNFIAQGLLMPGEGAANMAFDTKKRYFNSNNSVGQNAANFAWDASNVILPFLVPEISAEKQLASKLGKVRTIPKSNSSEELVRGSISQPWEGKSIKIDNTPFGQKISPELAPYLNSKTISEKEAEDAEKYFIPKMQMGGNLPGSVGFTYARTSSTPSKGPHRNQVDKTDASAQNGQEMSFYQHGLDWNPKMISKNGSVIKDDNGYWNPDNWGHPVEINSNNITMQGVHQPLLGISDTGHTQLMHPGEEYKFKGKKVTEFPIAQNGKRQPKEIIKYFDDKNAFNKAEQMRRDSSVLNNLTNKELNIRGNNNPEFINDIPTGIQNINDIISLNKNYQAYKNIVDIHNQMNKIYKSSNIKPIGFTQVNNENYGTPTFKKPIVKNILNEKSTHPNPGNGEIVGRENNLQVTPNTELIDRPLSKINTEQQPTNYSFHYPTEGTFDKGNPQGVKYFKDRNEWQKFLDENDYQSSSEQNGIGQASGILKKGRNGLRQEQKSLQNLDNLLNFTNYNTPQPGGWMDKYTH